MLRTSPEKVHRAFLDADSMAKRLPPHGFTGKMHHLDAREIGCLGWQESLSQPAQLVEPEIKE